MNACRGSTTTAISHPDIAAATDLVRDGALIAGGSSVPCRRLIGASP